MMPQLTASALSASDMAALKAPAAPVAETSSRLPSLDGWRALSILIVLGAHTMHTSGFPSDQGHLFHRLFDGHLGVRFFFVISGFLITWLMLTEERRTGTVDLKNFYIRRALRILPVYLVFLAVLAVLQVFTPFQQSPLAWFGNLTFTTNFLNDSHSSNHLWSLAVEEQFYLLWPALFVFFKPQASRGRCLVLLTGAVLLAVANRWLLERVGPESSVIATLFNEWSFFNNADSLCLGCVAAILLARAPDLVRGFALRRPVLVLMAGAALIAAPYVIHWMQSWKELPGFVRSICHVVHFCGGRTLQSLGFVLLLLQSVLAPRWGGYRLFNHPWFAQIGVLSYSIYIWQQLFCTKPGVFGLPDVWWVRYPFWLLPVLIVACISYYGLEKPLLQLRHRFR